MIHEQATAAADTSENTVRAPYGYSTCCQCTRPSLCDGTRVLRSAPHNVFNYSGSLLCKLLSNSHSELPSTQPRYASS